MERVMHVLNLFDMKNQNYYKSKNKDKIWPLIEILRFQ
jgi:hypothetical protein